MKVTKNLDNLTQFEVGQLDILKWIKNNIQAEMSIKDNKNVGYFLRETQKDMLYPAKIVIAQSIYEHIIEQIENRINQIEE